MIRRRLLRCYSLRQQPIKYSHNGINLMKSLANCKWVSHVAIDAKKNTQENCMLCNINECTNWVRDSNIDTKFFGSKVLPKQADTTDIRDRDKICGIPRVAEETFDIIWRRDFQQGDLNVVDIITKRIYYKRSIFCISQLLILLNALYLKGKYVEIHQIITSYLFFIDNDLLPHPKSMVGYRRFLEILLDVEFQLQDFAKFEKLFSLYIKNCRIQSSVVILGLKSFIINGNIQLSREFFIQIMNNPETFPLTVSDFQDFLRFLKQNHDYDSVHFFFQIWLMKGKFLNNELLMFMNLIYLKNNELLQKFLSNEQVNDSKYLISLQYELIGKIHNSEDASLIEKVFREYSSQINKLKVGEKYQIYELFIKKFKTVDNGEMIQTIDKIVKKDLMFKGDIRCKIALCKEIGNYFVDRGRLKELLQYYNKLLRRKDLREIDQDVIYSVWKCFNILYPDGDFMKFTVKLTNLIGTKSDKITYIKQYWWLNDFQRMLKNYEANSGAKYYISISPQDNNLINNYKRTLASNEDHDTITVNARDLLEARMKGGLAVSVQTLIRLLRISLQRGFFDLGKLIDNQIRGNWYYDYHKTPIRLEMIWLHYSLSLTVQDKNVQQATLLQFERNFAEELTFQNMIELSHLFNLINDFTNCLRILERAYAEIDWQDKFQITEYYMAYVKYASRKCDPQLLLGILKRWNQDYQRHGIELVYISRRYRIQFRVGKLYIKKRGASLLQQQKQQQQQHSDQDGFGAISAGHRGYDVNCQDSAETIWKQIDNEWSQLTGRTQKHRVQCKQDTMHALGYLQRWLGSSHN